MWIRMVKRFSDPKGFFFSFKKDCVSLLHSIENIRICSLYRYKAQRLSAVGTWLQPWILVQVYKCNVAFIGKQVVTSSN